MKAQFWVSRMLRLALLTLGLTIAAVLLTPAVVTAVCNYGDCYYGLEPPGCFDLCQMDQTWQGNFYDPNCAPFDGCNWYICWWKDQPFCGVCANNDKYSCF